MNRYFQRVAFITDSRSVKIKPNENFNSIKDRYSPRYSRGFIFRTYSRQSRKAFIIRRWLSLLDISYSYSAGSGWKIIVCIRQPFDCGRIQSSTISYPPRRATLYRKRIQLVCGELHGAGLVVVGTCIWCREMRLWTNIEVMLPVLQLLCALSSYHPMALLSI